MEAIVLNKPYKTFSIGFVRAYLITMRPYLLFVSGITGIAGMSFIQDLSLTKTILILLASFLSYGFGQALTDCFQTDTDAISSPYRPLTQGLISKTQVLILSTLGLMFCVGIFSYYNPLSLVLGFISGLGLATYTYFKKKFWAGPFYNAWIVAILFVMADLCGSSTLALLNNPKLVYSLFTVFFGYANFVLVGYFKDIDADSKTGYNTLPVVFGRKTAAFVSNLFGVLTILMTIILFQHHGFPKGFSTENIFICFILVAGILAMILCQILVHFIKTDSESSSAISLSVHSYILLLASITILNRADWIIQMIAFYILFNLTMYLRPSKSQI